MAAARYYQANAILARAGGWHALAAQYEEFARQSALDYYPAIVRGGFGDSGSPWPWPGPIPFDVASAALAHMYCGEVVL